MKQNNFNIGVIGVGHLGEHHVKHLKTIKKSKLIGIFECMNSIYKTMPLLKPY